jgi:hypothetical protein
MAVEEPTQERPTSSSGHRSFERHHGAHIERWWRLDAWRAEWRAGLRFFRWEHYDPQRVAVELLGETPVHVAVDGGEMVVYGPWRLTIQGLPDAPGRRVLATWSMRWLRASTPLIERWGHVVGGARFPSTGEEHAHAGGASELWLGASERLWLGASEWAAGGASEMLWLGASEWVAGGASEMSWLGASGRSWSGASDAGWPGGASRLGGASDVNPISSGERWGGR